MEVVLIVGGLAGFLALALGPALTMDAQLHRSLEVDPPMPHLLRFGPHQLIYRIAEAHPVVMDPNVLGAAERLSGLPGAVWFDGQTLAWDGPRSSADAVDNAMVQFRDALLDYTLKPWFSVAEKYELEGDRTQLDGTVDGMPLRLTVRGAFIHMAVDYGPDEITVRRQEMPGDTPIGDPILDLLHLEGPPHLLASLATDDLREELMAGVHGLDMRVEAGKLHMSHRRAQASPLPAQVAHALSLARLLRARLSGAT